MKKLTFEAFSQMSEHCQLEPMVLGQVAAWTLYSDGKIITFFFSFLIKKNWFKKVRSLHNTCPVYTAKDNSAPNPRFIWKDFHLKVNHNNSRLVWLETLAGMIHGNV